MIEVIRNTFIDVHYGVGDRAEAERIAKLYEAVGYSRESDDDDCIQLLLTSPEAERT